MSGPWDNYASAAAAPAAGPWAKYATEAPGQKQGVTPDNLVRSAASGATLGFADEIAAGGDAAFPFVKQFLAKVGVGDGKVSEAPDFSARYAENLARERGQDKAFAEQNPITDAVAKGVGGVASTVAALPAAAVSVGPSAIANVAKLTGTGAVLGGAQGFGEGEGLDNRLERAGIGSVVGGTLGAVGRPVAAVGRSIAESAPGRLVGDYVGRPITNAVGSIFQKGPQIESGAESGALNRMATALQRSKADGPEIEKRLGTLGEQAMLADTDPQFLSMARTANTMPGETRTLAKALLETRDKGAPQRMIGAFEGGEPPPTSFAMQQGMEGNKVGVGQKVYGAMRSAGLQSSPEMEAIIQRAPMIRNAITQIEQDAAATGKTLDPVDVMHRVKRTLNQNADAAFMSGKPVNKADVGDLANEFETAFWNANPAAKAADTTYAQSASLPDFFNAGHALLTRGTTGKAIDASAPALADLLIGSTPVQQLTARSGATNAVRETVDNVTRARALARGIDEGLPLQQKIGELYSPEQARSIFQRAGAEKTFAETSNELLRGSKTAEKTAEALDFGNAGIRVTPGSVTPRFTEHINNAINWVRAPNEAVRDKIGELALSPKTETNKRTLELLAAILQSRAGGARGTAGLASAAGGTAGGL